MLETLHITDYALIDEVDVTFGKGLVALTGETGAGKSIVIGALDLVLGARASSEAVRTGAKQSTIQALFRVNPLPQRLETLLEEHDIELDGDALLIRRVVTNDGRSRAYVGGQLVPLNVLSTIGDELVDLHGQHEHQSLLRVDRQLDLLDAYADTEHNASNMGTAVRALRDAEAKLSVLEHDDRELARRVEFMRFELTEIDDAALEPGIEEDTRTRRNLITNAEQLVTLTNNIYAILHENDDDAVLDRLDRALQDIDDLVAVDSRYEPFAEQLSAARETIAETARDVRSLTEDIEYDPDELDALNARLAQITALKRKYGESIEAILEYRNTISHELETFDQRDERIGQLKEQCARLRKEAQEMAEALSIRRKKAARSLNKHVTAALQELGMDGGTFSVDFEPTELTSSGCDRITFMLSANAGEQPKPLRSVASGGEISRIMLALKTVFAEADAIGTLVFDEIDAGVGGRVARAVADRLVSVSESHQVLCITHLPQIAAKADAHYSVTKHTANGRTITSLHEVRGDERIAELARLLDGSLTETSLAHARELLAK